MVIYTAIRTRIQDGTYPPGSPLPVGLDLMSEFATSRDTIQKAVQKAEDDGLIVRYPGLGYYVADEPKL
jgi:DNA-binding GntR family transcriptional regulator